MIFFKITPKRQAVLETQDPLKLWVRFDPLDQRFEKFSDRVTIQIGMKRLVGVRSQAVIAATIVATSLNKFISSLENILKLVSNSLTVSSSTRDVVIDNNFSQTTTN